MSPTPQRWSSLEGLYQAALEQPPDQRAAFLKQACDDEQLRREVESLLGFAPNGEPLLQHSPWAQSAGVEPGANLGPYRVGERIGAGGMGEVYRASDTRLKRDVALKVLPASMTGDTDRRARFMREAQSASRLNHPNIVTIYDVGEQDGRVYIAMEYVAGKTLDAVIPSAGLPRAATLKYAIPIAGALAKAHAAGIIHRDLKPGNIMVTPEEVVKVLDFGLAKLLEAPLAPEDATRTAKPQTQLGMVMGTPAFMSPEQAEGKAVDARSDIFSFGAILYEMVTGKRAFAGDSMIATMAAVLHKEPDPLPASIPPDLGKIIQRCLRKDPERRFHSMADVRVELEESKEEPESPAGPAVRTIRPSRLPWIVAACCALAAILSPWVASRWRAPAAERPFLQFDLDLGDFMWPLVSPNEPAIAYVVGGHGQGVWYRRLNQDHGVRLPGTDGASFPFFSPNGHWIGFFSHGKLRKITVDGDSLQAMCDAPNARGGAWSDDDWIAFAPNLSGGLWRVPASGGTPQPLTDLNGETGSVTSHRWLAPFPGAGGFLFVAHSPAGLPDAVRFVSAGSRKIKTLLDPAYGARYLSSGYLIYVQNDALLTAPVDVRRLELTGAAVPLADGVAAGTYNGAVFDASPQGTVIYHRGLAMNRKLAWLDAKGKTEFLDLPPARYLEPRVAPDGKRLAVTIEQEGNRRIWVYDLGRKTMARISTDDAQQDNPVWTPDGAFLIFRCGNTLCWTTPDGGSPLMRWKGHGDGFVPASVSPDGRWLLLIHGGRAGDDGGEVWIAEMNSTAGSLSASDAKPLPDATGGGEISPDGRWRAFISLQTGRREVYVTRFAPGMPSGAKWRASVDGGSYPAWRPGGKLFFLGADARFMVSSWSATGDTFAAGPPRPWSDTAIRTMQAIPIFDVAGDGSRIMVSLDTNTQHDTHLRVLLNVDAELARRAAKGSGAK